LSRFGEKSFEKGNEPASGLKKYKVNGLKSISIHYNKLYLSFWKFEKDSIN